MTFVRTRATAAVPPIGARRAPLRSERSARSPLAPRSRGVALLMVLIALGVAGAVTTFYLTSRDNSAAIGANAETTAQTSWAANSGAELGIAILQTDIDWLAAAAAGKLVDGINLSGATVSVFVTNLFGEPPAAGDRDLVVTSVATVNGVSSVSQKLVTVRGAAGADPGASVDPELGEFAVYATRIFDLGANALVTTWPTSPRARSGDPLKVGFGFVNSANATIDADADLLSSKVYIRSDASAALKSLVEGSAFIASTELPLRVPMALPLLPSAFASLPAASFFAPSNLNGAGQSCSLNSARYDDLTVRNRAVLTLNGPADFSFRELTITRGAVLRINGAVRIHLRDDFEVSDTAAIELATADSSVIFYAADDINIVNAVVGFDRIVGLNDERSRDAVEYSDPASVRILGLGTASGGAASPTYTLNEGAFLKATIHAPTAAVGVRGNSTLFGRVTANTLNVESGAAIYYDPNLDLGLGFTDLAGPIYDADGAPIQEVADALAAYNATMGLDALKAQLVAALTAAVSEDEMEEPAPGEPSLRIASRVTVRNWPIEVMTFETAPLDRDSRMLGGSITSETNALRGRTYDLAFLAAMATDSDYVPPTKPSDPGGLLSLVKGAKGLLNFDDDDDDD